ncbi:HAMP domain-containing sensor histidine kinase [uncultured Draconibacterium sp.]|uniref:sensor histidine kinase n=1 Tax=uncultured Draconibacterium sp. TaxID=1573823 RepID=UPI0029C8202F|nr:HAMP domain-containing sensor histidine kinase [uncultured Draconibacterium sp.]
MELNNLLIINIVNSGISLIMGVIMLFLNRFSYKLGTGYWASGAIIIGVGLLIKAVFPSFESFVIAGFPIFVTIGFYLYLAGIWKFKGKNINYWIMVGIPVLDVLQTILFFKIFPFYRIHLGLHYLFITIYFSLAIFEMIRINTEQKYLKNIFLLNALSFSISLVIVLLGFYILFTTPNIDPLQVNPTVIITFMINGFLMISLTFGFLTAVNLRLNMELEGQVKSNTKFLSIIAHDLRGPVGNITSFLDLLQNEKEISEEDRKKYLKLLNVLSQSTFHLLQNLLEWATKSKNLNKFESEQIELGQIISGNIDFFKCATSLKSIDLKFIEEEKIAVSGNSNMLETIVRNLISNAIKFTPNGGTITVTTEKTNGNVRLTVSDTGQGMKPELINSFYKFETNTSTVGTNGEAGSGLGLVLCKELASRMNGIINIESDIGVGTKVIIDFPLVV